MLDGGRTDSVLVVQSEPTVRTLSAEALSAIGFRIEEAGTGAEALNKVRAAQGRYDAVMLDDALADYAVEELAREFRALHADLAMVITPQEIEGLSRQFAEDRCAAVLARPYSIQQLQDTLRTLRVECPPRSAAQVRPPVSDMGADG